ncbi:MAG: DUF6204 family protein [Aquihabitans sp.]
MSPIYRAVVRGQFADLTPALREALLAEAGDHEIFKSSYTPAGTFTYERNLVAFSFRFEVRAVGDDPAAVEAEVIDVASTKAVANLTSWGIGYKYLKVTTTDMASIWDG